MFIFVRLISGKQVVSITQTHLFSTRHDLGRTKLIREISGDEIVCILVAIHHPVSVTETSTSPWVLCTIIRKNRAKI